MSAQLSLGALGCGGPASSGLDGTSVDTELASVGWFEVGWGDLAFNVLESGADLRVVWGGQGAAMFPLPVRGGEFELPDPPSDFTSERAPLLDLDIDIEGHNDGPGGHFKHLANYPIAFDVLSDGTYEFVYVAVILPDGVDPEVLDGAPAHVAARLRPYGSAALEWTRDLVVAAPK